MSTHSSTLVEMSAKPPPADRGSSRAQPLPADQRRASILRAALPLLLEHGAATRTRDMAEAAGVSEGTLFNVFADKDELLRAALDAAMDQESFEEAVAALDPSIELEARLVAVTRLIQQRMIQLWGLFSSLGPKYRPTEAKRVRDSPAMTAHLGADKSRFRVTPAEAARLLRALTLAMSHPLMVEDPSSAEEIVEVFLHGVEAAP